MKYPEAYSFFRIVDTEREAEAVKTLVENYSNQLFEAIGGEWSFDVRMLEKLEYSVNDDHPFSDVTVEEQEKVLEKLRETEFEFFRC